MFPRYKRKNQRYKIKPPKERMSFERKTALQMLVALVVVLAGTFLSFFDFPANKTVSEILYTTYDSKTLINSVSPALGVIKEGSRKIVLIYNGEVESAKKNLGVPSEDKSLAKASSVPQDGKMGLSLPLKGEVTSPYGVRTHPIDGSESMHSGVDIAAPYGQSVYSAGVGVVTNAGADDTNGNFVRIQHADGITTFYAHLSYIDVKEGDEVSPSVKIGEVGSSGNSTGPHLHFEVIADGKSADPAQYIKNLLKDGSVEK